MLLALALAACGDAVATSTDSGSTSGAAATTTSGSSSGEPVTTSTGGRGRVIEEPLERCLARVSRVQHLELAQLLER